MASFSQANRPLSFRVHNPKLDADALVIERLKGTEAVSELFDFQIDLLAADGPVSFDEVLNQSATVTIADPGGRFFSGIVRSLEQRGPRINAGMPGTRWPIRYRAHLVPALWRLTRRVQSRVLRRDGIQQMTVPELLEQVLVKEWGLAVTFQMGDQRSYRRRDHLVQYRESDFALVARRRFRKRNVGGRPMKRPKSVEGGLTQLQEQARRWLAYYNEVWLSTFRDEWGSLQRKESEAAFQKKLKAARKAVDRVAAAARSIKNTLDELKKGR